MEWALREEGCFHLVMAIFTFQPSDLPRVRIFNWNLFVISTEA
jgi:hypothetical protein